VSIETQEVHFSGQGVVLTSPLIASAAEVFTMATSEVADATVIGNSSFGEFSNA